MPTCIIADDEPMLRAQLRKLLAASWPDLDVVAEAQDGLQAVEAINTLRPTISFLDIRMPGLSGIELAPAVSGKTHVVLVTAHEEYALAAFEAGAADYVVKPIDPVRLLSAVERLRRRIGSAPPVVEAGVLRAATTPGDYIEWVQATVGNEIRFITVDEIVYFDADTKYTRVVLETGDVLIRKPIKELLGELDPKKFWQTNRGTIVNTKHLRGALKDGDGGLVVVLKGRPEKLRVSRAHEHRFRHVTERDA